jgi:tetrahydromethanopterin S-methyltransferase subunit E
MGKTHVLAVAILGAWIASTLCMWFGATRSFATVESVLKKSPPQFVEITKPLGEVSTRVVLRYMASEINRTLFWGYGALQIALGTVLFLLLWRETPRNSLDVGMVTGMLVISVILTLIITPLIISLGRSIDFLPRTPPPPLMPRFWALHGTFTGLDGVKLLAGIGLLFRWISR